MHDLGRWVHLGSGFAAVGLGALVMLLPKFGPWAAWHRRVGRVYAALMAGSCLLGVPLAYFRGSTYLMVLGASTLALVIQGWADGRAARAAMVRGDADAAGRRLRWHLILMGASYIGAWSGFFATNPVFGAGEWQMWAYVFGPSVVGAVFIARAALRLPQRPVKPVAAPDRPGSVGSARPPVPVARAAAELAVRQRRHEPPEARCERLNGSGVSAGSCS